VVWWCLWVEECVAGRGGGAGTGICSWKRGDESDAFRIHFCCVNI
jgi:hypothetical protein